MLDDIMMYRLPIPLLSTSVCHGNDTVGLVVSSHNENPDTCAGRIYHAAKEAVKNHVANWSNATQTSYSSNEPASGGHFFALEKPAGLV